MLLVCVDSNASEAIDKALLAGYKQVGLEHSYNQIIAYGANKSVIWGIDKELGVIGYCVRSIRSESLKIYMFKQLTIEIYKDKMWVRIPF